MYLELSILASPATTISIGLSSIMNDKVLAIRHSSVPRDAAARATVAVESDSSIILSSILYCLKYSLTFSIAILSLLLGIIT